MGQVFQCKKVEKPENTKSALDGGFQMDLVQIYKSKTDTI